MTDQAHPSSLRDAGVKNIRAFSDLHLDFTHQGTPRKRTVIIGQNSTGKTTLLRSLILALTDFAQANVLLEFPNGDYVARNHHDAFIDLEMDDSAAPRGVVIQRQDNREYVMPIAGSIQPAPVFVVGYGVSRSRTGKTLDVHRTYRISDATRTLFDLDASLTTPELSLRRLKEKLPRDRYRTMLSGIQKALGLSAEEQIVLGEGGGIYLQGGKEELLPLEGWADGHRFTFQWMVDVYAWALHHGQLLKTGDIQGILLVDEIEQHLHPSLQVDLMQNLSGLFPAMQIIATTHSPLVVMGVEPHEVVVLQKTHEGTRLVTDIPDFSSFSLEDVVEDERLFSTQVFASHSLSVLQEYRRMSSMPPSERTEDDNAKLRDLTRQFHSSEEDPVLKELRKLREALERGER